MTVDELLAQPWSWQGPVKAEQAGEEFYKMTIEELPQFVVTGITAYEVLDSKDRKLRAFLEQKLEKGGGIKLPSGLVYRSRPTQQF